MVLALSVIQGAVTDPWLAVGGGVRGLEGRVPGVGRWLDLDGPAGPGLLGEGDPEGGGLETGALERAVILRGDPDGRIREAWAARGVEAVVGSARPGPGESARARVSSLLGVAERPPSAPWVGCAVGDPGGPVLIHPGSGSRAKRWPLAAFRAVEERLVEGGIPVRWVLGPAEEDLRSGLGAGPVVDLGELVDLVEGARGWVGCDSGASHLAAACGAPAAVVFGPTDPGVWAPAGAWVRHLAGRPGRGPSWGLEPREVVAALGGAMVADPRRPCPRYTAAREESA